MMGRVSRYRVAVLCLLVLLLLVLTGCSSWHLYHARSEPVAPQKRPKQLRAHLVDGRDVVLHDPWFVSDTLYGLAHPSNTKPELYGRSQPPPSTKQVVGDTTAIPIAQIASLEAYQYNSGRTRLFVLGVFLGLVYGLLAIAASAF